MQSLFMDFSGEAEGHGLDSPGQSSARRFAPPSNTIEILGATATHRAELEGLFATGLKTLRWAGSFFVAEMNTVESAFNVIAKYHHTLLSDGS